MRTGLLLMLLAAPVMAGDSQRAPVANDAVLELVARLGSTNYLERLDARAQLLRMGPEIHPLLEAVPTNDPEVARLLRGLTRSSKVLRLTVGRQLMPAALGSDVLIPALLINRSPHAYRLRVSGQGGGMRDGAMALSVSIDLDGGRRVVITQDSLRIRGMPPRDAEFLLPAGDRLPFEVRIPGKATPVSKGGRGRIRLMLSGGAARLLDDPRRLEPDIDPGSLDSVPLMLHLESGEARIEWRARPLHELDALLKGADSSGWHSARSEIRVRPTAEVVSLLREHATHPWAAMRVLAIERLGSLGKEEDLDRIRAATTDVDHGVQLTAIAALGNFKSAKARRRLLLHLYDYGLREAAIRALTRHKHAATIDSFIQLLKNNVREGAWVAQVQDCLEEWTGLRVENRLSEITSFEQWWIRNRARWAQDNLAKADGVVKDSVAKDGVTRRRGQG